jgi:hypothetical protein
VPEDINTHEILAFSSEIKTGILPSEMKMYISP